MVRAALRMRVSVAIFLDEAGRHLCVAMDAAISIYDPAVPHLEYPVESFHHAVVMGDDQHS